MVFDLQWTELKSKFGAYTEVHFITITDKSP